jgi:hypothetical protein
LTNSKLNQFDVEPKNVEMILLNLQFLIFSFHFIILDGATTLSITTCSMKTISITTLRITITNVAITITTISKPLKKLR